MKKVLEKIRAAIPYGIVDAEIRFSGEYTPGILGDSISGTYFVELRIDENNEIVPLETGVRSFISDDGEEFDPHIAVSEIDDILTLPFEILKVELVDSGK